MHIWAVTDEVLDHTNPGNDMGGYAIIGLICLVVSVAYMLQQCALTDEDLARLGLNPRIAAPPRKQPMTGLRIGEMEGGREAIAKRADGTFGIRSFGAH